MGHTPTALQQTSNKESTDINAMSFRANSLVPLYCSEINEELVNYILAIYSNIVVLYSTALAFMEVITGLSLPIPSLSTFLLPPCTYPAFILKCHVLST